MTLVLAKNHDIKQEKGCGFYSSVAVPGCCVSSFAKFQALAQGKYLVLDNLESCVVITNVYQIKDISLAKVGVEMRDNSIFISSESGFGGGSGHFTY